jgi:hypothetical protein
VTWYHYLQNNSGGKFIQDPKTGLSRHVYIEAESPRAANARAQDIGLYFDGYGDCPCCGDRWWEADSRNAVDPEDVPVEGSLFDPPHFKWIDGPETYVHPADQPFYAAQL